MATRTIVDPHHHLWDTKTNRYPWLTGPPYPPSFAGDVAPIAGPYCAEDYRRDASAYDVRKTVHVDGGCADPFAETQWLNTIRLAHGFPNAVVAGARLEAPGFPAALERQLAFPALRGVRQILNWDPDPLLTFSDRPDYMTDRRWLDGYALLARRNLSFDLQVYPWQLKGASKLANAFPDAPIILNHTGMPFHQRGMGLESWRRGMRDLARCENATVKISGLGMVDWKWTKDLVRPLILETIEIFGVERCMFASNFPVDKLYSSFEFLFRSYEEIVMDFSETEKNLLFAANAERVYRI